MSRGTARYEKDFVHTLFSPPRPHSWEHIYTADVVVICEFVEYVKGRESRNSTRQVKSCHCGIRVSNGPDFNRPAKENRIGLIRIGWVLNLSPINPDRTQPG